MPLFDTTTTDAVPHATARMREDPAFPALVRFFPTLAVHRLPRDGALTLGRHPEAKIVLAYRRASREHAVVRVERGTPTLTDVSSRNGTFVNAQRLASPRTLADGDVLRAGGALFVFRARSRALPPSTDAHEPQAEHGLVGPVHMRRIARLVDQHARTDHRVLVLGETGTGKELVARALARASRPGKPFVAINVAAIPRDLFEAELFGHGRGAFSGATAARLGAFRTAHEGVLFLDEVGDLSPECQAKLLRVLEERAVRPVGADRDIPVDVRVVAATERSLRDMVLTGTFRASLYNRLREVEIHLPPLRDRVEDLPSLVACFTRTPPEELDPEAIEALACHKHPGNVRELAAILREATRIAPTPHLDVASIRAAIAAHTLPRDDATAATTPPAPRSEERDQLLAALRAHGFNVRRTAEALGRPRSYIYRAVRRLSIPLRQHED